MSMFHNKIWLNRVIYSCSILMFVISVYLSFTRNNNNDDFLNYIMQINNYCKLYLYIKRPKNFFNVDILLLGTPNVLVSFLKNCSTFF